ncbi:MAG: hypothetical protein GY910_13045 [bacterium]|nr:hypothetical protein [bacterium]
MKIGIVYPQPEPQGNIAAISTMGTGHGPSVEPHLDFIGRVADRLGLLRESNLESADVA